MEQYLDKTLEALNKIDLLLIIMTTLKIIGILVATRVVNKLGAILIDQLFKDHFNINEKMQITTRRVDTLSKLLKNILSYSLYFIAIITILDMFNVPVKAILGGAGIIGVAIGFGAQNLVKDIITGFFIIFEDQYAVGEYVDINGKIGTVEEIGLRLTKVRDWGGQLYIIPNGNIGQVTNYNRGSMRAIVEIGISYKDNLKHAIQVIEIACEKVYQEMIDIIDEKPFVHGVTKLDSNFVTVRVTGTTKDMSHWMLERNLRLRIREEFDSQGLGAPFQHIVYINADDHKKDQESLGGM
ncbi:small conductance mechanosensitive channel [Desulfonispora thiosulfatigenes DSM 11270]|uniref:Small conductance mechanosensitive channel n=1 Tax=Desulfonispora thiosulfatigenes DSM 11270 TaxID=656914 RepID=A0A1W1V2U9_DESTI|nr:mechanosensitive ion channel family protein [Desulfonispora thiosulfatigenes]SMB87679.1 small conductance mechanosensitive channel [Desulfonispora thiosulfatigenes DSM 11270]